MYGIVRGKLPVSKEVIEDAVRQFADETDIKGDVAGFVTQTLGSLHAAIYQNSGDCWFWWQDDKLLGYMLARVVIDVDNTPTYWVYQAWIAPGVRGTSGVKQIWNDARTLAKNYFCKHIVVVSNRKNSRAYCRWLGKGWTEYVALLKEDI